MLQSRLTTTILAATICCLMAGPALATGDFLPAPDNGRKSMIHSEDILDSFLDDWVPTPHWPVTHWPITYGGIIISDRPGDGDDEDGEDPRSIWMGGNSLPGIVGTDLLNQPMRSLVDLDMEPGAGFDDGIESPGHLVESTVVSASGTLSSVPAPGAIGLLGLAGLMSRRRRRA